MAKERVWEAGRSETGRLGPACTPVPPGVSGCSSLRALVLQLCWAGRGWKGLWAVSSSSSVAYDIAVIFLPLLATGILMEPVFIVFIYIYLSVLCHLWNLSSPTRA